MNKVFFVPLYNKSTNVSGIEIPKLEIAAVSALCWLSQFCTLKKNRGRLREYLKIRQFDTYQIAFLMRNQGHKGRITG